MAWRVALSSRAQRDLARLADANRAAVIRALRQFEADPSRIDLKKLGGGASLWRLRVGRWRSLLELDTATGVATVTRVLPRDRAYRD